MKLAERVKCSEWQQTFALLVVNLFRPDMELSHWVTGLMGRLGHLSRPGHHFDPV